MKNKAIYPVLFGFFIMGFCDVVGIATSYIKKDFGLSESIAGLIPSALFIWFLVLSIPTAFLMNKVGRKNTVLISNVLTFLGMLIPFIHYDFAFCMVAFAFLGMGNAILQVSLNPLLANVVPQNRIASALTTGQVIKAVSSFCGPFIALLALNSFGNWKYLFPIFGGFTVLSSLWLLMTNIQDNQSAQGSSLKSIAQLLTDKTVLLCFIGIVAVVGLDVGMNTVTPKLLIERLSMPVESAGLGSSFYFICRTAGAFLGAFLLAKMSLNKYFRLNMIASLIAIVVLFFVSDKIVLFALVGGIGFFASSIFAVLFSFALNKYSDKENEISGLMITGVFGGALIPPLMGLFADLFHAQAGSLIILTCCILYLLTCSFVLKTEKR